MQEATADLVSSSEFVESSEMEILGSGDIALKPSTVSDDHNSSDDDDDPIGIRKVHEPSTVSDDHNSSDDDDDPIGIRKVHESSTVSDDHNSSDDDDEPIGRHKVHEPSTVSDDHSSSDDDDDPIGRHKVHEPSTVSDDHNSSDDDDDPIGIRKKSSRSKILDDSDEDSDSLGDDEPRVVESAAIDSDHSEQPALDFKETEPSGVLVAQKSRLMALDDSDEDVDSLAGPSSAGPSSADPSCSVPNDNDAESSAMQTAEWVQQTAVCTSTTKAPDLWANSDLFDAELDDDDNEKKSDSDEGRREDGDSEEDCPSKETTKAVHKKTAKASRAPRMRKTDITQIHSESQRIVRESRLRIPYHKPEKLDLSVFLQRTQQKQALLQKMGHKGPSWKIAPVIDRPAKSTSRKRSALKRLEQKSTPPSKPSIPTNHVIDLNWGAKPASDDDCLPDLDGENDDGFVVQKCQHNNEPSQAQLVLGESEVTNSVDLTEFASKVQSDIAAANDSTSKPGEDSGYITTPVNSSEEENSADDNKNIDNPDNECRPNDDRTLLTPKLKQLGGGSLAPQLSGAPGAIIDFSDDEEDEGVVDQENTGVNRLMERLMSHNRNVPRKSREVEISTVVKKPLEGGDEELQLDKFTYLVEGEELVDPKLNVPDIHGVSASQVEALVTSPRLLLEKAKRLSNLIQRAKLCLLRERLRAQMRVRREVARKKREEMHELDNEEGFEDEEAELTDQTDTDDEEVEEEEDVMEEEEDVMEEAHEMETEKERNPFLDAEAEDEEGQDEEFVDSDEEDLQLKLDSVDYDDDASAESKHETLPKNYLKAALEKSCSLALFDDSTTSSVQKIPLKKPRSFELFDEDANTESPTMSQKSNTEKHEISERPFEQLSGNSVATVIQLGSPRDPMQDDVSEAACSEGKDETNVSILSLFKDRDTSFNSTDTSFEMVGSLIPAGQRPHRRHLHSGGGGRDTPDMFTGSSKSSTATTGILSKSASRLSDLELPIEDTQDLFNNSPAPRSMAESTPRVPSQSFHFSLNYESQSQMLDDDGMLKVSSVDRKAARRQLHLDMGDSGASGSMTQELLGLCSGQFAQDAGSAKGFGGAALSMAEDSQSNTDELLNLCSGRFSARPSSGGQGMLGRSESSNDMGELLGLCSGKFNAGQEDGDGEESPMKKTKGKKRKVEDDDDDSNDSFGVASNASVTENMPEENLDSDEDIEDADQEEGEVKTSRGRKHGKKHGLSLGDFVDEEAELSGSEFDSDENVDLSEDEDILETEAGDADDLGTEEHLRDQVGRVHLKTMIDSDKRELMLLQEMYLPDGDLHSDGGGRFRRFRWKNVDEDTQQDMFDNSDDEEAGNEEEDAEDRWRAERHAREKFLEEQAAKEDKDEGGCKSPEKTSFMKMCRVTFKQKKESSQHSGGRSSQKDAAREKRKGTEQSLFKMPAMHGSLLRMNKGALAKIADMAKPSSNVNGPKNLRKFVFTALSPEKVVEEVEKQRPQVRRSVSVDSAKPVAKKPRLEKSSSVVQRRNSIFDLF